MKRSFIIALVLLGVLLVVTACGGPSEESADAEHADEHVEDDHGEDEHADDEHADDEHADDNMDHVHVEAPDEFDHLTNPFAGDANAIDAGQDIFVTNCATCHGATGAGDGDAAAGLDPKPADLGDHDMMSELSDGYLFWRVTKGGTIEPFNSAMPSWEQGLTEEQRWQVISYVRTFSK